MSEDTPDPDTIWGAIQASQLGPIIAGTTSLAINPSLEWLKHLYALFPLLILQCVIVGVLIGGLALGLRFSLRRLPSLSLPVLCASVAVLLTCVLLYSVVAARLTSSYLLFGSAGAISGFFIGLQKRL